LCAASITNLARERIKLEKVKEDIHKQPILTPLMHDVLPILAPVEEQRDNPTKKRNRRRRRRRRYDESNLGEQCSGVLKSLTLPAPKYKY
jgi:hypothetical protein